MLARSGRPSNAGQQRRPTALAVTGWRSGPARAARAARGADGRSRGIDTTRSSLWAWPAGVGRRATGEGWGEGAAPAGGGPLDAGRSVAGGAADVYERVRAFGRPWPAFKYLAGRGRIGRVAAG